MDLYSHYAGLNSSPEIIQRPTQNFPQFLVWGSSLGSPARQGSQGCLPYSPRSHSECSEESLAPNHLFSTKFVHYVQEDYFFEMQGVHEGSGMRPNKKGHLSVSRLYQRRDLNLPAVAAGRQARTANCLGLIFLKTFSPSWFLDISRAPWLPLCL